MNTKTFFILVTVSFIVSACGSKQEDQAMDFDRMTAIFSERMALQKGERVFILAQPGRFNPLIEGLEKEVKRAGGIYLGSFSTDTATLENWETDFTRNFSENPTGEMADYFRDADVGIMMPGALPYHPVYAAMQEVLREGRGRTVHFHWSGAYDLNGNPMEITRTIDSVYQQAVILTDYKKLSEIQMQFEAAARNKLVRVTTKQGTNISFQIGDRPVTKQDGDASASGVTGARNLVDREIEMPAGAIRVAPIEESVNGPIVFPQSNWNGIDINNLILVFNSGRIASVESFDDEAVEEELKIDDVSRSFREFALGFNPLLTVPLDTPWIPYYGYGAGVVRLSMGDNTELGGKVSGNYVRWNFFIDATVTVGDEVWVKDGKLMK